MSREARYRMPLFRQKQRKLSVIDPSLTGDNRGLRLWSDIGSVSRTSSMHGTRSKYSVVYGYIVQSCTVCLRMRDGDHVIYLERALTHES
jgi:hypothetical protein